MRVTVVVMLLSLLLPEGAAGQSEADLKAATAAFRHFDAALQDVDCPDFYLSHCRPESIPEHDWEPTDHVQAEAFAASIAD